MTDDARLRRDLREIARDVAEIDRRVRGLEKSSARNISITGSNINIYDSDGNIRQIIGLQPDGSYGDVPQTGVTPPKPSPPQIDAGIPGVVRIGWDGKTESGIEWPSDFSHVDVHINTVEGFIPNDDNQVHSFMTAAGGMFLAVGFPPIPHYVVFTAKNTSGEVGPKSDERSFTPIPDLNTTDGNPPASSPAVTCLSGIGSVFATWDAIENPDPTWYNVYISSQNPVNDNPANFLGKNYGTVLAIETLPDGSPLTADTTYYVAVVAEDADGAAAMGAQGSAAPRFIETIDVADVSIGTEQIMDAAIELEKIADGAVSGVKITNGAITATKISADIGGGNELTNSSFENNIVTPWVVGSHAIASNVQTDARFGTRSLQVTHASAGSNSGVHYPATTIVGQKYVFTAWVKRAAGTQGVSIESTALTSTGEFIAAAPDWVRLTCKFTASSTTTNLYVKNAQSLGVAPAGTGSSFYLDGVQLEQGDVATMYAPKVDEILPGTITSPMITDGAVTESKIGADAVTSAKITDGAVTASKISATIGGGNIVRNSSFESGSGNTFTSWSPSSGNVTLTAQLGRIGTGRSVRFTSTGFGNNGTDRLNGQMSGVDISTTVTLSYYYRRISGSGTLDVAIDGVGGNLAPSGTSTSWERVTSTFQTAAGGGPFYTLSFYITNAGSVWEIDDVQVELSDIATAYAPMASEILPGTVGTDELSALAVTAEKIAANTITADKIATNTITANEIQAGAITADELAAGAVTANKLNVIVGGGNIVNNSSFENTTLFSTGWTTNGTWAVDSTTRYGGIGQSARGTRTSGSLTLIQQVLGETLPASEIVTVSAWVYLTTAMTVRLNLYQQSPLVNLSPVTADTSKLNQWQRLTATYTVPQVGSQYAVRIYSDAGIDGTFYVDAVQVEHGELATAYAPKTDEILPGTIVSNMIAADTISAANIAAGAITADELAAGSVTTNKLAVIVGGGNLLSNSGFENTTLANWSKSEGGTGGVLASNAVTFISSAFGNKSAALTKGSGYTFINQSILIQGQQPVTTSAYVYCTSAINIRVVLRPNAGTAYLTGSLIAVPANTWTRVSQTLTPNSTSATTATVSIGWEAGEATQGVVAYFDNVQSEIGDIATSYAPKTDEILPGTIIGSQIAADTITATNIAANAITTDELSANAVTAAKIAANTITANEIAANAITTDELAANVVTADKLQAGAVTANKLAVIVGGGNLLYNSSFEGGTYRWAATGTGVVIADEQATKKTWAHALRVTMGGSTSTSWGATIASSADYAPVTVGRPYTGSAWVKSQSGTPNAHVTIRFLNASFGVLSETASTPTATNATTWTRVSVTATAPASAAFAQYIVGASTASAVIFVDDVQLEEGDVPTAYSPMVEEILPGTILTEHLSAGAVTAEKIAANAISADMIAAGSITTEKLSVANYGDNKVPNGSFEDGTLGWAIDITLNGAVQTATTNSRSGTYALQLLRGSGATSGATVSTRFIVEPSSINYASFAIRAASGSPVATLRIDWYTTSDAFISSTNVPGATSVTATATYTVYGGTVTAPSNAGAARIVIINATASTTLYVDEAYFRNVIASAIIADGAITTNKLQALSITADKIATNSLTASQIAAGAITADELAANSVIAGKVASNAIIASNIQAGQITSSHLTSGAVTAGKISAGAIDSMTIYGVYIYGNVYRSTSYSNVYVEMGDVGSNDAAHEIRFIYGSYSMSLRNASSYPGSAFFSLYNPSWGANTFFIRGTSDGWVWMGRPATGPKLKFTGSIVQCRTDSDGAYGDMACGTIYRQAEGVPSYLRYKNNVRKVTLDNERVFGAIKQNGLHKWAWNNAQNADGEPVIRESAGLIADYLPDELKDDEYYYQDAVIAFMWEAIKLLDARLDTIESKDTP